MSKGALEIPTGQDLHEREFPLIPVDKERTPLAWSSSDMSIKHSYSLGLKKLDIPMVSGIIDGVRFRKLRSLP